MFFLHILLYRVYTYLKYTFLFIFTGRVLTQITFIMAWGGGHIFTNSSCRHTDILWRSTGRNFKIEWHPGNSKTLKQAFKNEKTACKVEENML